MARGDITAAEVFSDREMLNRLGYGIFDITFGESGVGFENVKDFSYVVAQDEDPKLYRRKVFELTGHYYSNDLAKALWNKFIDHKWVLSEKAGHEVNLAEAAQDWVKNYSHQFLKEWTFKQREVPERIRNKHEPQKGLLGVAAHAVMPNLRELLDAGFSITDVARAAFSQAVRPGIWREVPRPPRTRRHIFIGPAFKKRRPCWRRKPVDTPNKEDNKWQDDNRYFTIKKLKPEEITEGRYYVQLLAKLTGHVPHTREEAERRWHEILEHKWYMSERAGHDVGIRTAALDYFRRLNLLQETETGQEV
ncbi:MAG TPA: DUF4032 domain-containing protein [Chloroflexia bacterium]|nr:DUF4032 domain-containing protein [Chloroflexia bacterium]